MKKTVLARGGDACAPRALRAPRAAHPLAGHGGVWGALIFLLARWRPFARRDMAACMDGGVLGDMPIFGISLGGRRPLALARLLVFGVDGVGSLIPTGVACARGYLCA